MNKRHATALAIASAAAALLLAACAKDETNDDSAPSAQTPLSAPPRESLDQPARPANADSGPALY